MIRLPGQNTADKVYSPSTNKFLHRVIFIIFWANALTPYANFSIPCLMSYLLTQLKGICTYEHRYELNETQLGQLRRLAKKQPCSYAAKGQNIAQTLRTRGCLTCYESQGKCVCLIKIVSTGTSARTVLLAVDTSLKTSVVLAVSILPIHKITGKLWLTRVVA